tara:strand:- start:6797 stop:7234 length:438 start_codon:yes stop_codon:yes gene_type:complete
MNTSNETEDIDSERLQKTARGGTGGGSRRGFPGTGSLERVPAVVREPLDASGQIRMAGSWPMNRWCSIGIIEPTVLVGNLHDQRRTGCPATADASQERGPIGLDSLPGTPAVSTLTTSEFFIDEIDVEIEAGWKTREDGQSAWAM